MLFGQIMLLEGARGRASTTSAKIVKFRRELSPRNQRRDEEEVNLWHRSESIKFRRLIFLPSALSLPLPASGRSLIFWFIFVFPAEVGPLSLRKYGGNQYAAFIIQQPTRNSKSSRVPPRNAHRSTLKAIVILLLVGPRLPQIKIIKRNHVYALRINKIHT